MIRGRLWWPGLIALVLVAAALVLATPWVHLPRLTEREVRDAVYTTIQRETPEAFLVTGSLELVATVTVQDSRTVLPGLLDLSLGTSQATVRIPGRVTYGFDVGSLTPAMIRLREDSIVHVVLPELRVFSVEPRLAELEVDTERGWARLPRTRQEASEEALGYVEGALRVQAREHLRTSIQPRVNTANAVRDLLMPVLLGLGMEDPRVYVELGQGIIVTPAG
jgi:hypothetical protein